jgi:uncharacterized protein (DUF2236 family)
VNAERVALLSWPRAILLQLAHPLVAAGVADHSTFREGRLGAARRLHHTVRSMLSLTFGTGPEREATIALINGIHRRVNGVLREGVGPFAAGTPYTAEDPALLVWVYATLVESVLEVHELVVEPLTPAERDDYVRDGGWVVAALGAPDRAPGTWDALQAYMGRMYASGEIAVGNQARELASAVLAPPFSRLAAPVASVNRLITAGLLPAAVRGQYGFDWSARHERRMARWLRAARRARSIVPDALALWPEARRNG